jgi:hypothetical protein
VIRAIGSPSRARRNRGCFLAVEACADRAPLLARGLLHRATRSDRARALRSTPRRRARTLGVRARGAGWRRRVTLVLRPRAQLRRDDLIDQRWAAIAPIFPRKEIVPVRQRAPTRSSTAREGVSARYEIEMTRSGPASLMSANRRFAAAIAERVELLDIADVEAGLLFTQPRSESSSVRSPAGSNSPNGKPLRTSRSVARHDHIGRVLRHRDDDGGQGQ